MVVERGERQAAQRGQGAAGQAVAVGQRKASSGSLGHPPLELGFAQVEERLHNVLGALVHRPLAHNVPAGQEGRGAAAGRKGETEGKVEGWMGEVHACVCAAGTQT